MSPKVVVGMSGGVDSAVAALLLKQQGYQVIGLFMKNWDERDERGVCQATKDFEDVARVCDQLDVPYYSVEFIEEYRKQVFDQFLKDYASGLTPNPDVLCNREIKFAAFAQKARALGGEYLATGHYCQILNTDSERPQLLKGADPSKDQSYFLNAVGADQLKKVLFPIGAMLKTEIRAIAAQHGFVNAKKKDSTGICFIGERDFKPFLSQFIATQPGEFKLLDGTRVGRHSGSAFYTLGQRRGLGLGGEGEAWFVVAKDTDKNIVYLERGSDHPALYSSELWADGINWLGDPSTHRTLEVRCRAKVRYRQADQDCMACIDFESGNVHVTFDSPQRAVTPGQSVVFYDGERCLGGAVIRRVPTPEELANPRSA
jgi:tRNA-specific 2-thiouridylase